MNNLRSYRPVRIGRTTNRQLGFITTTPSDSQCPYFHNRFIRHGVALKENRAICDKHDEATICDYRKVTKDGIPFCLRYWYGPKYEIVDEVDQPIIQKIDEKGRLLYYEDDGVTETYIFTSKPVLLPVSEAHPLEYIENSKVQKTNDNGDPLYWDTLPDGTKVETIIATPEPVWEYTETEFYSTQYEDTHEKIFGTAGNRLGWHHDV